jgi:hypothetical protein
VNVRVMAATNRELTADIAEVEAGPFPSPETLLDGVYAEGRAPSPIPPLVRDWERRKAQS